MKMSERARICFFMRSLGSDRGDGAPSAFAFLPPQADGDRNPRGQSGEQSERGFAHEAAGEHTGHRQQCDENAARAKGKKSGAKTGGGAIMIAISPADTAAKASEKLRKGFEKMRAANDGLAALAAFLVDALDEAAAE